jgi:hypothetical protein
MENQKSFTYWEAVGKSVVWASYAHNFSEERIKEIGYNPSNDLSYIELENGIFICSSSGRDAFYQVRDEGELSFSQYSTPTSLGFRRITELNNFLLNEF